MEKHHSRGKRQMQASHPFDHGGSELLWAFVVFVSKYEQGLRVRFRSADEVGALLNAASQVEILPTDRRSPDPPQPQIPREAGDQVIDSPELSVTLDQNVSLPQPSPRLRQRQIRLETFGAQDLAQGQQSLSHRRALRSRHGRDGRPVRAPYHNPDLFRLHLIEKLRAVSGHQDLASAARLLEVIVEQGNRAGMDGELGLLDTNKRNRRLLQ